MFFLTDSYTHANEYIRCTLSKHLEKRSKQAAEEMVKHGCIPNRIQGKTRKAAKIKSRVRKIHNIPMMWS